jgi:hypothetical protein
VSEKRLSEIMSDANHALEEAQEALDNAILESIGTHFDAGVQIERERIIKLLEEVLHFDSEDEKRKLFALITGGQK